jgi:hypothetical protein
MKRERSDFMAKIKAPNSNFNGEAYGVNFVNGEAETSDKWTITMLTEIGCTVETKKKQKDDDDQKEDETNTEK